MQLTLDVANSGAVVLNAKKWNSASKECYKLLREGVGLIRQNCEVNWTAVGATCESAERTFPVIVFG